MKKIGFLLLALLLLIPLAACNRSDEEGQDTERLRDARYYHPQTLPFPPDIWAPLTFLRQGERYLLHLDENEPGGDRYLVLHRMDADGALEKIWRSSFDFLEDFGGIPAVQLNPDDSISMIVTKHSFPADSESAESFFFPLSSYIYYNISPDGEIISQVDMEAFHDYPRWRPESFILNAAFDLEGNAIFLVDLHGVPQPGVQLDASQVFEVFLLDSGFAGPLRVLEGEDKYGISRFIHACDGSVFALDQYWEDGQGYGFMRLREIDFAAGAFGDSISIPRTTNMEQTRIFAAPLASDFAWYVIEDSVIYGYCSENDFRAEVADLSEFGIHFDTALETHDAFFWPDGRILILQFDWDPVQQRPTSTLTLLTPADEPWGGERTTITLGGIYIGNSPLALQAAAFNRHSLTHEIVIQDYTMDDLDRLRVEIMAGGGPDILVLSGHGTYLITSLAESPFLLDLYPLIDADSILTREDFFPSILSVWENSRGELIQISPDFILHTILGRASDFPQMPDSWTYADFISFYEESLIAGIPYPFGQIFERMMMVDKTVFADDFFASGQTGRANFANDSFLAILEAAYSIPPDQNWETIAHLTQTGQWDVFTNIERGEQILAPWRNIRDFADFLYANVRLGGLVALGFPAQNTPTHGVQASSGAALGIRANSPHIETAWEFVRMGLMPDALLREGIFSVRIDLFEREVQRELNREEPIIMLTSMGELELPPLTEAEAELLRNMIANIGHTHISENLVRHIVHEEVLPFFAGDRNAEDTARIIQNRVQMYLSERA